MGAFRPIRDGTLSGLLRSLAAQRGDADALAYPAFATGGEALRLSAAALDARVDDLARGLIAQGVRAGDHVALWAPNAPDWIPLEFALARVGAVLVTVNTALAKDEVAFVLRQSKATAVLHTTRTGSNEASASLDALLAEGALPGVRARVWLPARAGEPPPDGVTTIDAMVAAGEDVPVATLADREAACRETDVCNIQYTSGTTGFPKGVMLTHRNLIANAHAVGDVLRFRTDDRVALFVPLFHCYGCAAGVLGTFAHGASIAALVGFEPGDALRLIESERATVVHGVPTMYGAMLAHPDRPTRDLSSLRVGTMAGAPCPEPLLRRVRDELHVPGLIVAYGLTETSPALTAARPDDDVDLRCTTVGRALPGAELAIAEPDADGRGELLARGPYVMAGYHDDDEATAAAIDDDGWFRTGDLATIDADGWVRIVGRLKDVIIRGGENIAPAEIEAVLREHPDIADAAVVGVPDERLGEELAAAVVLVDGARFDPESYEELLRGRVASFKVPPIWERFDAFPLTGSGKVKKFEIRARLVG